LVSTIGNCSVSSTLPNLICVENTPNASFTSSSTLINGSNQSITFYNSSTNAASYLWTFGDFAQSVVTNPTTNFSNVAENTLVTLYAYSANGCVDSAIVVINYNQEAIFYVPNSFTPDQDELNQNWGPVFTKGFDPFNFDLFVFNRWGEVIWESHDAKAKWDGTYGSEGMQCPQGVYTWKIAYKPAENDDKISLTGHITLIR
jgi:gliding motility-associated-like protein